MKLTYVLLLLALESIAAAPKVYRNCRSTFGGTTFDLLSDGSTQYVNFKHGKDAFYLPLKTESYDTGGGRHYTQGSKYNFVFKWSWVHDTYPGDSSRATPYDYEYTTAKGERVAKEIKCRDVR